MIIAFCKREQKFKNHNFDLKILCMPLILRSHAGAGIAVWKKFGLIFFIISYVDLISEGLEMMYKGKFINTIFKILF